MAKTRLKFRTVGYDDDDELWFSPDEWLAHGIEDAVGFDHGDGCWAVAFTDLEKMYKMAKAVRERNDGETG